MGFLNFLRRENETKKKLSNLHKNLDISFSNIRKDIENFSKWVVHLNEHKIRHHSRLVNLEKKLLALEKKIHDQEVAQSSIKITNMSKQQQTDSRSKRTAVGVQTPVQTPINREKNTNLNILEKNFKSLTPMERVVLWTLINTELKLSYDDLSTILGRDKSTLRGQVNNIKRKSESLLNEYIEINGKKRFFVDDSIKKLVFENIARNKNNVSS